MCNFGTSSLILTFLGSIPLKIVMIFFQCTELDHEDKSDLIEAVAIMADVAAFINESKRRKDIGN